MWDAKPQHQDPASKRSIAQVRATEDFCVVAASYGDNSVRRQAEQRESGRTSEVDEKELLAGGAESVRGMHWLRAGINIISGLLTESWAELSSQRAAWE